MGLVKQFWMEQQEEAEYEEKINWMREYLGQEEIEEFSEEWYDAEEAYEQHIYQAYRDWEAEEYLEDNWSVRGKTSFDIFTEIMENAKVLSNISISANQVYQNLLVMLHGHVIAGLEAYLSTTFSNQILHSDELLRKLVENDPVFAQRKFSIQEIFTKREQLNNEVKVYLRDLIFHDIAKVKPMYLSVLDIDFGNDLHWLFSAVMMRHDCVHRAGYDKEGNAINLTKESIEALIQKCSELVAIIEEKINANQQ